MTIDALRGRFGRTPKVRRPGRVKAPEPIAIGETDKDIFNCPNCARPLAVGTPQCLLAGELVDVLGVLVLVCSHDVEDAALLAAPVGDQ